MRESPYFPAQLASGGAAGALPQKPILTRMLRI
jgi:hypothetical protein